jgi:hypothetical protein
MENTKNTLFINVRATGSFAGSISTIIMFFILTPQF